MADKGLRVKGKTYKSLSEVPEQYRAQWESGSRQKDPGNVNPNVGPNAGRTIVPHVTTFSGIVSTLAKTYRNHDEAIRHNVQNAHMMRRDPMIMGPLLARQRAVALLNWSVEPEDKTSEVEVRIAKELTKMISMIPRFTEYRRNLLEAVWYGRYAIQHKWSFVRKGGAKGKGIIDWVPVHGDKIMFRYDDGTGKYDPNEIGIKVSPAHVKNDIWAGKPELEYNTEGSAVFLRKWERSRLALHKHLIMDGDYEDPTTAGMIHGVGLRHFLYWAWFQKQETLAQLAEIVERTGMGFTIYYYPAGNEQARAKVEEVAEDQAHKNQIIMPYDAANPGSYGIDQVQPVTAGIPALTNLLDEYWGSWIIRFILGQTLSMRDGGGGLGTGTADLHKESFLQIIEYDAHALDETLTQDLVRMYVMFNYPSYRHINFKFKSHTEKAVPLEKLQSIQAAWSMGAKVKAADVMDLVGMTVAGEEDDALYNPQLAIALKQFRETMDQDREQQVAEELAQQQSKEKESVQRYSKLYERRAPVAVRRPARRGPKGMTLGGSQAGKTDKPYKSPKELVYKDPEKNSKDGAGPGDHSDSDWDVTWKQFLGELTGLRAEMPEEAYGSAGIAAAQKYMPRDPGDKENPDYKRAFQYAEGDDLDLEGVEGRESELSGPDVSELQAIESEDIEGQLAQEQIDARQATDIAKEEAAQIKGVMDDEQLASDIDVQGQEVVSEKPKPEDLVDYHPERDRSKEGAHFDEETTPIRLAYLHGIRKAGQPVPTNLLDNLSRKEREAFTVAGNMDKVQQALSKLKSEGKIEKGASLLEAKEFFTGDDLDAYKDVSYKFGLNPDTGEREEGKFVLDDKQKRMAQSLSQKNANDFLSSYEINPKALEQVSGLMEAKGVTAKDVIRTEGPQAYIDGYQRRMSSAKRQFNSLVDTFKNMERDLAKAKTEEDKEDIRNSMQKQTEVLSGEIEKANKLAERLEAAGLMSRAESQSHKSDIARLMKPIAKGTRKFGDKTFEQRTLPEVNIGELHSSINESMKEFYDLNRDRIQAQKDGDEDAYKSITAQMATLDENIKSDHDSFKSLAGDDYTSEVKKSFNSFARKSAKYIDTPFGELEIQRKTTAGTQLPDLKGQEKEAEAKPEISEEAQEKIDALGKARVGDLRTEAVDIFGELGIEADPKGLKKAQLRELLTAHYSGEDITQSELLKPEEKAPTEDKPPVEDKGKVVEGETEAEVQNPFMTEEAQKVDLSKYPGVRHVSVDTIDAPKNLPDAKITVTEPFNFHNRMVVGVDINGVKVPFYVSTGDGRKKTVATDKFYPFFGMSYVDKWFNKWNEELINNYYDQPVLAHVANSLNEKHKDLLSEHAKDSKDFIKNKIPQDSWKWKEGQEDASDWVFPGDIQEGLNPTDLTDQKDPQFVGNIMGTVRRLQMAVYGKSSIAEDDPRLQPTETKEGGVIDKATGSGLAQSIAEGEVSVDKEEEEDKAPVTGQPPAGDGGAEPPVTGDGGEGAGMPEGEGDGEKKISKEELIKRLPNEPETLDLMNESYIESRDRYIDSLPSDKPVFANIDNVVFEYEEKVRDLSPPSFRNHMIDVLFEGKEPKADSDLGRLYSLMISQPREKMTDILVNIRGEQVAKRLAELGEKFSNKALREEALLEATTLRRKQEELGEGESVWDAVVDQANIKLQEARRLPEEQEKLGEPDLPIDVNLQGIKPEEEVELGAEDMQVDLDPQPPRQVEFDWGGVKISARRQDYIADIQKAASGMTEEQLENQARSLGQIKPEELGQLDKDELVKRFIAGVKRRVQRDQLIEDYRIKHSYDDDESGEDGFLGSYIEDMKRLYPEPPESDTPDVPDERQAAYKQFIRETARDRYVEDKVLAAQKSESDAVIAKNVENANYKDWVAKRSALVTLFGDAMIGTTGRRIRELPEFNKDAMAQMDSNVLATAEKYLGFNPNEDRFQRDTVEETKKAQVEGAFEHLKGSIIDAKNMTKQYSEFMNSLSPEMSAKLAGDLGLNKRVMLEFSEMPLHKQTFVASKLLNHAAILGGHKPDRTKSTVDGMADSIDYLVNNREAVEKAMKKEYGSSFAFENLNWKHITLIIFTLLALSTLSAVGRSR